MKKKIIALLTLFGLALSSSAFAAGKLLKTLNERVVNVAGEAGLDTANTNSNTLAAAAGTVVASLLAFVGIIFFILIIYAGFLWMTAGGNEEKVTKAKAIMKNSLIGLLIVFAAAVIYALVSYLLTQAGLTPGDGTTTPPPTGP